MAFSAVTERGSATEKLSDTSHVLSPSAALAVNRWVVFYAVTDNTPTTSGASTEHSVSDTDGHTWTKLFERTMATAAAEDGVTHSAWLTKVTSEIGTGDSFTLTLATARIAKVLMVFEFQAGTSVQKASGGEAFQEANTGTPSVTISSLPSIEYLFLGFMGRENNSVAWNEDADYTNVFASEGVATSGAAATSNVGGFIGSRIATLTGDTFNPTISAADVAVSLVALEEVAGGTPATVTPGVIARSFTVPAVIVKGSAVTTPGTVARSLVIPAVAVKGSAVATPATIARSFILDAVTVKGSAVVTPTVIARAFGLDAVTVKGSAVVTPSTIIRVFTLPPVTAFGGGAGLVSPAVIATIMTLPGVTVIGSAVVTPSTIAQAFSLGAVTVKGSAVVNPSTIVRLFVIPQATAVGGAGATVTPSVIAILLTMPAVTIKGSAVVTPGVIPLSVVFPELSHVGAPSFWDYDPAGYTLNPAAYVPVLKDDDPPWD